MKANLPRRFLTLRDRDRNGTPQRRSKSSDPNQKSPPFGAVPFFTIFRDLKHRELEEREKQKIDEVAKWVEQEKFPGVTRDQIPYVLSSQYSLGDVAKAKELLRMQSDAFEGVLLTYNPNTRMLGAENRGAVTCYLDALLFAMFAKMEAFECMLLRREYPDEAHRNLAALLRLWVNMLRSGKLIRVDMTEHIQNALAACGWADAKLLEQQDTSEAFAFITETLQLPLLTLQVDLFHHGKRDADDHKVVFERLLNLAVPADPDGKGIKLEDCLEEYFNTKVDVLRDSPDDKKGADRSPETPVAGVLGRKNTIRVVTDVNPEEAGECDDKVEKMTPLQRRWTTMESPASSSTTPTLERPETRPSSRARSTSIIQRVVLDAEGKPTDAGDSSLLQKVKRQGSTVVKAVTIPAWQFFRLIPWHTTGKDEPMNDTDVAAHLNKRPVVGICLKRYMMTEQGQPRRQNTFIDIPDSMRLPHFMLVDDARLEESNGLSAEYKLVLQSVVCHRGESLHSGHYISFARVAPKLLTDNRRHEEDPPPDYEDAQWVKFDDLLDDRVTYVDDIKESLKNEMPYLLFYQIVPIMDVTAVSADGTLTEPPSYNDSTVNVAATSATVPSSYSPTTNTDSERPDMSRQTSGYFDGTTLTNSTGPSIRFSSDLERPGRLSLDNEASAGSGGDSSHLRASSSRRSSVPFSEVPGTAGVTTEVQPSLAVIPNEESTTAQRLSRAAARFTKNKDKDKDKDAQKDKDRSSRPASQAGEGRMSLTMSRLGGLMRTSKEPLRETTCSAAQASSSQDAYEGELASALHVELPSDPVPACTAADGAASNGKKEGKEKGKSRPDSGKPEKEGKERRSYHHGHNRKASGEPERECVVM